MEREGEGEPIIVGTGGGMWQRTAVTLIRLLQQPCRPPDTRRGAVVVAQRLLDRAVARLLHRFWQGHAAIGSFGEISRP